MNECCKDKSNGNHVKFKDVLVTEEGFYFTVYLHYCKICGNVLEMTWVE